MFFPDVLEPFRLSSKRYLSEGRIKEVLFSGPTYQIEMLDVSSKESVWVFVQFARDNIHDIKDLFCSCQSSSETGSCEHMAACCNLMQKRRLPPHARFDASLYKTLFFELFMRCHIGTALKYQKKGSHILVHSQDVQNDLFLFSIAVKDEKKVETLFFSKKEETEENSIKFSSLTEEELDAWRNAKTAPSLGFELSFLSDIAKYLFLNNEVSVDFVELDGDVPRQVIINSPVARFEIPLDEKLLTVILKTLVDINSNLLYFDFLPQDVLGAVYDDDEKNIQLTLKHAENIPGTSFLDTQYLPKIGFVKKREENRYIVGQDQMASFLSRNLALLKKLLPIAFDDKEHPLNYQVEVTARGLAVETSLFETGDLCQPKAFLFYDWAYIPNKGFVRIEPLKFQTPSFQVLSENMGDFLRQHRFWLSQFPPFQVHVAKVEEKIAYEVSHDGTLLFHQEERKEKKRAPTFEFNDWIFVKNRGFFLKETKADKSHTFLFDTPIPQPRVCDFILRHIDIISHIPNFFASSAPITKMGLEVLLMRSGRIQVRPKYEWINEVIRKSVLFFDEFLYVPKLGFYRLPIAFRPFYYIREIKHTDREVWNNFFLEELPKLRAEIDCYIDKRLELAQVTNIYMQDFELLDDTNWKVDLHLLAGGEKISLIPLLKAKIKGERFVPTLAGVLDLEHERFQFLSDMIGKKIKRDEHFLLSSIDLLRLQACDPIVVEKEARSRNQKQQEMLFSMLEGVTLLPPSYPQLQATLRSYQARGVEWLYYLYQNRLSGLLSDDMGVGKTHQAMALMAAVHEDFKNQSQRAKFLIICPTSLVFHWEEKIKQFLPILNIRSYISQHRTLENIDDVDVILTTYGLFRSDVAHFKSLYFEVAIFDELQIAKNHVSQIHAALLKIAARMRIGLTGTPIENELRELKSIFDLVLPGYMPEEIKFRDFFIRPIEREMNSERKQLLSRLVRPFILRRRKQEVLPDLPAKVETVQHAELLGEQKSLYKHVATLQAATLLQQLQDSTSPIPYMHIFALLSALKQICNHPAAYLKDVENYTRYESGKWELFVELLEEAIESRQKVVVFSQYLSMLDIIEAQLRKMKLGFAQIRGETKLRGEEVARFQKDPHCQVFLGSLQAAGLGIDLTAAEVVIHYDRWWNPAKENQATDRVHRIGQERGVQVIKLVTKHTIEERIDAMIERKKGLLDDIVSFDDQNIVKKLLTRDEIILFLEELKSY